MAETQKIDGFKFLCRILEIMDKNPETAAVFGEHAETGMPFTAEESNRLAEKWAVYSNASIIHGKQYKDTLIEVLYENCEEDKSYTKDFQEYINAVENYMEIRAAKRTNLSAKREERDFREAAKHTSRKQQSKKTSLGTTFINIFQNQNGSFSLFFLGFSMTIAMSYRTYDDWNFYVGEKEAKKILFESLNVLGVLHAEFIPEKYYTEEELRSFVFVGLYSALRAMFPIRANAAEKTWHNSQKTIQNLLSNHPESKLYSALNHANEAYRIQVILWENLKEQSGMVILDDGTRIALEHFYTAPTLNLTNEKNTYKLLECDDRYRVRAFVIGKSGSGKTFLMKAIAASCMDYAKHDKRYAAIAKKLGIQRVFFPLILSCKELQEQEILRKGLIKIALEQMYSDAIRNYNEVCLRHWEECYDYIETFCSQKALNGELLLLVDDYSKMSKSCTLAYANAVNQVCRDFPDTHIVMVSNRLKNSEMLLFRDYRKFEFHMSPAEYMDIAHALTSSGYWENVSPFNMEILDKDRYIRTYVNTPRHLVRYLMSDYFGETTIDSLVLDSMEEELESKCQYECTGNDCKELLKELAIEVLLAGKRKETAAERLSIPDKMVNRSFYARLGERVIRPEQTWEFIQKKAVLIDRKEGINRFEFSNPLYLYSLAAEYYLEILKRNSCRECIGMLISDFNQMAEEDFSYVIVLMMNKLSGELNCYGDIANSHLEQNITLFAQAVAAYAAACDETENRKQCESALGDILQDLRLLHTFTSDRSFSSRVKCWDILRRTHAFCRQLHDCESM